MAKFTDYIALFHTKFDNLLKNLAYDPDVPTFKIEVYYAYEK